LPERDGYIAGVPCWADTSQPDPDAATDFYGSLFGWEFEDAMPAGAPARYLIARLRGGDVAAVSSQPGGAPPRGRLAIGASQRHAPPLLPTRTRPSTSVASGQGSR